jgi:predicted nuclease with TOPRIM domain
MTRTAAVLALCAVLAAGCSHKEEELQKRLDETQKDRAALEESVTDRDKYIDEVMHAVNSVYADLEQARVKEGKVLRNSGAAPESGQSADVRATTLNDLRSIGDVLKENRKRITDLQKRLHAQNIRLANLDTLLQNLQTTLREREQSIAMLQGRVAGLETTVAEKVRTIEEKELQIDDQRKQMRSGYYVVGTREELKKKGIITDEGGFLWGLLGSTTIMASAVDPAEFTVIDKTQDQEIHVNGQIEEILPRRNADLFATDETRSELRIVQPDKFWQDKYLVVVVN